MDETLGNVSYEDEPSPFLGVLPGVSQPTTRYSEDTTRKIDEAVRTITKNAFTRAGAILKQNHEVLKNAAKLLLEHETLEQEALKPFALQMKEHSVLPVALPAAEY
jgi:cell division protease FtsH